MPHVQVTPLDREVLDLLDRIILMNEHMVQVNAEIARALLAPPVMVDSSVKTNNNAH